MSKLDELGGDLCACCDDKVLCLYGTFFFPCLLSESLEKAGSSCGCVINRTRPRGATSDLASSSVGGPMH